MPATGIEITTIPSSPEHVLATVRKVLQTRKYEVHEISQSDQIVFTTRKTLTSWELNGSALVAAVDGGTQLTVVLQGQEGQPKALMDGVKNTKMAKKLVTEISGAC